MPWEVGGGPVKIPGISGRFHGNPLSGNQPCQRPPTSIVTLKTLEWRSLPDPIPYYEPLPMRGGKGWALNWQNRQPKKWSTKLNWASKLEIWWPKQWFVQGSDPQRTAQQTTASMVTTSSCASTWQGKSLWSPNIIETAECNGLRLT